MTGFILSISDFARAFKSLPDTFGTLDIPLNTYVLKQSFICRAHKHGMIQKVNHIKLDNKSGGKTWYTIYRKTGIREPRLKKWFK